MIAAIVDRARDHDLPHPVHETCGIERTDAVGCSIG